MHPTVDKITSRPPHKLVDLCYSELETLSFQLTKSDATLYAYASTTAYNIAADSQEWDNVPNKTVASARGNQTIPLFPSLPSIFFQLQ